MKSVIFFGTPDFSATILSALLAQSEIRVALVVTQPDRPARRGKQLQASPVKALALAHNIPVLQPTSLKKELASFLEHATPHGPFDIGVVVAFGQILPRAVLDLPQGGCLNIHASLLPRWRGAAPIQRAVMAGDFTTGVALMKMEEGLDTGPVYAQIAIPIGPWESAGSVHDRLAHCGAEVLVKHIDEIIDGSLAPVPQSCEGITYASKITPADEILDFSRTVPELLNQIRGLCPAPGAYTYLAGQRIKILEASASVQGLGSLAPGSLFLTSDEALAVSCGSGAMVLERVIPAGRSAMTGAAFARGLGALSGLRFGGQ